MGERNAIKIIFSTDFFREPLLNSCVSRCNLFKRDILLLIVHFSCLGNFQSV